MEETPSQTRGQLIRSSSRSLRMKHALATCVQIYHRACCQHALALRTSTPSSRRLRLPMMFLRYGNAHHDGDMPDTGILKHHHIPRLWQTTLVWWRGTRGNLDPAGLCGVEHPQRKGIGGKPHGIDLGVSSAHKADALIGAVGPG